MNEKQHPLNALLRKEGYKVVLASGSPRRRELLKGLDIDFVVKSLPDPDESFPETLLAEEIPLYIARNKAEAYRSSMQPGELVITADTIVWIDETVLGKPQSNEDAGDILRKLSGRTHEVITGVCLTTSKWQKSFTTITQVSFSELTDEEISYYIEKYHPMDKAGAYGVQEWIGYIGVERICGSYYNVMGLPVQKLYKELMKL